MSTSTDYEYLLKILILGDTSVGKTNLLLRFTENEFIDNYLATIGFDYKTKILKLENGEESKTVKLQVWDTAGQERFLAITKNLYSKVQGIIVMFDVTQISSFENIEKWLKSIEELGKFPIVLVGNKIDLENKVVDYYKAKILADKYDLNYFETSAKANLKVNEPFEYISKVIVKNYIKRNSEIKLKKVHNSQDLKKRGCC